MGTKPFFFFKGNCIEEEKKKKEKNLQGLNKPPLNELERKN